MVRLAFLVQVKVPLHGRSFIRVRQIESLLLPSDGLTKVPFLSVGRRKVTEIICVGVIGELAGSFGQLDSSCAVAVTPLGTRCQKPGERYVPRRRRGLEPQRF